MKKNQILLNASGRSSLFSIRKMKTIIVCTILVASSIFVFSGCRKIASDDISYYGYGKLTVECEKKCHVTFGTADKLNDFDVDATMATYVFRYQSNYDLDIKVTPVEDQNVTLNVYSREQHQIFHNTAKRIGGEVWQSIILVP